jgi:hypothetical protein
MTGHNGAALIPAKFRHGMPRDGEQWTELEAIRNLLRLEGLEPLTT